MSMTETNTDADTGRRLNRTYRTRDGKVVKQIDETVTTVTITAAKDEAKVLEMDLVSLFGADPGPCMGMAAAALGLATSVSNAVAAAKTNGWDVARQFVEMQERWQTISEGEWRSDREGGPRTKYLVEAYCDMLRAQGYALNEDVPEKIKEKLVSGEWTSKKLLEDATFKAFYAAGELRRATEKAKAAEQAAQSAAGISPGLVLEGLTKA